MLLLNKKDQGIRKYVQRIGEETIIIILMNRKSRPRHQR